MASTNDQKALGRVPPIDRPGPPERPDGRPVMRQKWRDLLFVHWRFQAEIVRPLVPPGLELDLHEGWAYVGLVPFTMTGVRPVFLPTVPGLSTFHETNLRTYVRTGPDDPGVWFFNLEAASSVAVRLGRAFFHLPYHRAKLFLEHEPGAENPTLIYAGTRLRPGPLPVSYAIKATVTGPIDPARPGSLDHFLAERYILHTLWKDRVYSGRVHHPPYPLQPARVDWLNESMLAAVGLNPSPDAKPIAHYACGVDVDVYPLRPAQSRGSRARR